MKARSWHLITGEYPPQPGGVSDYCAQLAIALAGAGDEVHIWAPPTDLIGVPGDGVRVHRLSTHFGLASLRELGAGIDACPPPRRLFVQYVAGAFGYRAMNVPLCLWLSQRRADPIWVMFHEFAYPLGWRLKPAHNLLGLVTPVMGSMLAARADRIFISTPSWERRIPAMARRATPVTWLPVPSNLPLSVDDAAVTSIRKLVTGGREVKLIGHFGTYGPSIAASLSRIIPALLRRDPERLVLLLGRGSEAFTTHLTLRNHDVAARIVAAGALSGPDLATHLKACDLLVQPYPDGVTSRRGSLMASLALGIPVVTNWGASSETLWRDERPVALARDLSPEAMVAVTEDLLATPTRWAELGWRASALYRERFALEHSVTTLRGLALHDDAGI